jgi:hypothetical protein
MSLQAVDRVETLSWSLLAAATVGSAWCAYQSSLWNGEQTRTLARVTVEQFASSRKSGAADRNVIIDVGTFLAYVEADLRHEPVMAGFLRQHARPEFKPALEAWIGDRSSGSADLRNPFARPEYRLAEVAEARALDDRAVADLALANAANDHSDLYVLHTVIFALALFFLGATSQSRRRAVRVAALAFGGFIFMASVVSTARLPRVTPQLRRGAAKVAGDEGG